MKIDKINHKEIEPKELTEIIATTNMAESIAKVQSIIQKSVLRDKNDQPVFATDSANFIKSIINSKRGEVVLYFNEDDLVGFFELTCPDNPKEIEEEYNISKYLPNADINNMGVAESIVVLPEYRGNHLQYKMFKRMEELASERNLTSLIGTVHPENVYSCENFEKSGYTTATRFEAHGGPRLLKYKEVAPIKKKEAGVRDLII